MITLTITAVDPNDLLKQLDELSGQSVTGSTLGDLASPVVSKYTTGGGGGGGGFTSGNAGPGGPGNTTAPRRGRPPKDSTAQVSVVEEAPATEAISESVVETPEADGEKTSWDYNTEIKPAVLRVSQKGGRPMVEALLLPFKVTNANQIPPEQHAELMAAIDTLLAA